MQNPISSKAIPFAMGRDAPLRQFDPHRPGWLKDEIKAANVKSVIVLGVPNSSSILLIIKGRTYNESN